MSLMIRSVAQVAPEEVADGLIQAIGIEMFGTYVLPVELVAVLLIVGMIGAIVIAKEDDSK